MSHPAPQPGNGPWRLLILDRDPTDPKWILATVATPADVRPAGPAAALDDVTLAWAAKAARLYGPAVTRLQHAEVWRIDEHVC
jgi:hypothetical protein